ncbi:Lrp/AsnC family transcriptional regulator [Mycobacterium colombiense]
MLDQLDAQILHALQLAPRVSFRRIATVVEATEQTVARRYHRLRRDGVVRVVGLENRWVDGEGSWVCRMHAAPERIQKLADALVRRPDVSHANVLAGWTDLVCVIRAPLDNGRQDLLQLLPRTTSVTDITIDLLLHSFGHPASAPWTGYGHTLTDRQAAEILAERTGPLSGAQRCLPTADDRPIFEALAEDGRMSQPKLAARAGWSVARLGRRIAALEACGALLYDVDLLPERLGHQLSAMLWLTLAPRDVHRVGECIAAHHHIAFAGAVSGTKNLVAIVICRDIDDLYRYLSEQLGQIEEILSYEVNIRTQRLKQHGSLVAQGRLINPRPIRTPR